MEKLVLLWIGSKSPFLLVHMHIPANLAGVSCMIQFFVVLVLSITCNREAYCWIGLKLRISLADIHSHAILTRIRSSNLIFVGLCAFRVIW